MGVGDGTTSKPCPSGKYYNGTGFDVCPNGSTPSFWKTSCNACPPGWVAAPGEIKCRLCGANGKDEYADLQGLSACKPRSPLGSSLDAP